MGYIDCPFCNMNRIRTNVVMCSECEINARWNQTPRDTEKNLDKLQQQTNNFRVLLSHLKLHSI